MSASPLISGVFHTLLRRVYSFLLVSHAAMFPLSSPLCVTGTRRRSVTARPALTSQTLKTPSWSKTCQVCVAHFSLQLYSYVWDFREYRKDSWNNLTCSTHILKNYEVEIFPSKSVKMLRHVKKTIDFETRELDKSFGVLGLVPAQLADQKMGLEQEKWKALKLRGFALTDQIEGFYWERTKSHFVV